MSGQPDIGLRQIPTNPDKTFSQQTCSDIQFDNNMCFTHTQNAKWLVYLRWKLNFMTNIIILITSLPAASLTFKNVQIHVQQIEPCCNLPCWVCCRLVQVYFGLLISWQLLVHLKSSPLLSMGSLYPLQHTVVLEATFEALSVYMYPVGWMACTISVLCVTCPLGNPTLPQGV